MKLINLLLILCLIFHSNCFPTQNTENNSIRLTELNYPKQIGWVNDFAHIFLVEELAELDSLLREYNHKSTNEIAIVTITELPTHKSIEDYTDELAEEWGVGLVEVNNGLVILLSMKDREIRISTGEGTRKFVSDEFLIVLIDSTMIPKFKEDKFYEGIGDGLEEIIKEWDKNLASKSFSN